MNKLGLIGGTSWHSTIEYYRSINQYVNDHFGNNTNPPLLIYTINQCLVHQYQRANNWEGIAQQLIEAAKSLERAGVDQLMFCANTPHKVYDIVQKEVDQPILHIADATAKCIKMQGIKKVGFLGTKYSMTDTFISNRLEENGIEVLVPQAEKTIEELHRIIQEELTYGNIFPESKAYVSSVIQSLVDAGAEGAVLGCTEFPLMYKENELSIPVFNTTLIHAMAGAKFILKKYLE